MNAKEVLAKYLTEINKHDFDRVLPYISDECKFWFSSGTYAGLTETRQAFEKTWGMIKNEVYSISDETWLFEATSGAVCTYTFHWEGLINGEFMKGSGRGTSCLRLESGEWKIVHEHLSHFPKKSE